MTSSDDAPRALTKDEMRGRVMSHLKNLCRYWQTVQSPLGTPLGATKEEEIKATLEGFLHSTLVMFDGCSSSMPALSIVPDPHPSDKDYRIEEGENYWEAIPINDDVMLHDLLWDKE